jgi:hypothetical protein
MFKKNSNKWCKLWRTLNVSEFAKLKRFLQGVLGYTLEETEERNVYIAQRGPVKFTIKAEIVYNAPEQP